MLRPLVTAIRTLTILPVPGRDTDRFDRSLWYFPVAGAVIGAALLGMTRLVTMLAPGQTLLAAVLLAVTGAMLTGALHLDGLADTSDAFGGGKTREDMLRILKDSRIGTFGAVAIAADLLCRTAAYAALLSAGRPEVIAAGAAVSRPVMAALMASLPYARSGGGTASPYFQKGLAGRVATWLILLACLGGCIAWLGWFTAGVAALTAVVAIAFFCARCLKLLGGITGDCIGAANEIFELLFCIAFVFIM